MRSPKLWSVEQKDPYIFGKVVVSLNRFDGRPVIRDSNKCKHLRDLIVNQLQHQIRIFRSFTSLEPEKLQTKNTVRFQ